MTVVERRIPTACRRRRAADDVRAAARDGAQLRQALESLSSAAAFGRPRRELAICCCSWRLAALIPEQLGLDAEGDVLLGEGVREPSRVPRVAGRRGDVEHVRVRGRFDFTLPSSSIAPTCSGASCLRTPSATSGEWAIRTSVLASRCGSPPPEGDTCSAGVRQRAALEGDAGGRRVGLRGPDARGDDHHEHAREHDRDDHHPAAPQDLQHVGEGVALRAPAPGDRRRSRGRSAVGGRCHGRSTIGRSQIALDRGAAVSWRPRRHPGPIHRDQSYRPARRSPTHNPSPGLRATAAGPPLIRARAARRPAMRP